MSYIPVEEEVFGRDEADEVDVKKYILRNSRGMRVEVIEYGATILSILVPDKQNDMDDVVLGYKTIKGYVDCTKYIGSTIGRVANRIANGKFKLNDVEVTLTQNNLEACLHGGSEGYNKKRWDAFIVGDAVTMTIMDYSDHFLGQLKCNVTFQVTEDNELIIRYLATTTEPTPISLTNHSYFNLAGHKNFERIYDHTLCVNADTYTPTDAAGIPTGQIASVNGTKYDLRQPVKLGDKINEIVEKGFDHNYCVKGTGKRLVAQLHHPKSGRLMLVFSTLPGVQVYTSNFLPKNDDLVGKHDVVYKKHSAVCLETQHYPNAVNEPKFPSCVLNPDELYDHETVFKFSVA